MSVRAAIFDAFGTLVKITKGTHPYREIFKLGIEQGRRPQPSDAENLLTLPLDLREAADFFGISVKPALMAQLENNLLLELDGIRAYDDGLTSVKALKTEGIKVVVCSNLAKPYASAIERLYPRLDGYAYSFEVGAVKPAFEIYQTATDFAAVSMSEAWMVGDSKYVDCDAPSFYGIRGFFLDRRGTKGFSTLYQFTEQLLRNKSPIV